MFRPVEEVKAEGSFVKAITFKPYFAIITCAAFGILLLIVNNIFARILGAFFILFSFFVVKEVKDYKVMDIFDKGVMIYGDRENKMALFLNFEDIREWAVSHDNGRDMIEFILKDGRQICKNTFAADKAHKALYALIREKERSYIRNQESEALTISGIVEKVTKRDKGKK